MKFSKVWGLTEKLFSKNNVSIHRIEIDKGGYCSQHIHRSKYNMFYVECGKIEVQVFNGDLVDKTVLSTGELTSVPPEKMHMFVGLEDSVVYEIYYTDLVEDDIDRFTVGGKDI